MKQPCEKTKMVTETSDIGMLIKGSPVLIAEKDGGGILKEPYEKPKMVTESTDVGMLVATTIGSPMVIAQAQPYGAVCPPCP